MSHFAGLLCLYLMKADMHTKALQYLQKGGLPVTDQELRTLMKQSADEGQRALFDQYFNYVYAIVFRILKDCGTHADAEECTVDTLADVMRHFHEIQGDSLKAYIGTAAKRKAINACRALIQQKKRLIPLSSIPEPSGEETVEETTEQNQLRQILLSRIAALGEPDTSILIQKFYYRRKSSEIARILGLSPTAVRQRCTRAVKRLKQELSDWEINW